MSFTIVQGWQSVPDYRIENQPQSNVNIEEGVDDNGNNEENTSTNLGITGQRDYPGTTIMIQVKEKYSFSELKEYISKYFHYPSVEIDLVDTDILQKYTTEENLFNISSGFLRRMS